MEEYTIEKEIWKDIIEYEGIYQVSNLGRIKSLDRYVTRSDGGVQFIKGRFIKPIQSPDGYLTFKLCRNNKQRTVRIHRIVAMHFLDVPKHMNLENYEVNHKDYDRTNNCVDNLEWCTHQENIEYSSSSGRYKIRDFSGKNNPNYNNHVLSDYYKNNPEIAKEKLSRPAQQNGKAKKVELYDENMNYIKTFDWVGGCVDYLKQNGLTTATVNAVRDRIRIAIKENRKYLNHYFKDIA